jgi:hypothetical protein
MARFLICVRANLDMYPRRLPEISLKKVPADARLRFLTETGLSASILPFYSNVARACSVGVTSCGQSTKSKPASGDGLNPGYSSGRATN